jgi:hypothetical protein
MLLTVGESTENEEGPGRPHTNPGDLLEGAGGVCEKFHGSKLWRGAPAAIKVLREVHKINGCHIEKNTNRKCPDYNFL